jgi:hypothetical protein
MRRRALSGAIVGAVIVLLAGCTGGSSGSSANAGGTSATTQTTQQAYAPHINPAGFTTTIDNKYFPLKAGTTFVYQGKKQDATIRDVMAVTHTTKQIMGVKCVVVNDKVWENGKLTEQTLDWYAQDKQGNVWYFRENSKEFKNGKVTSTGGSWTAGKNGAKPGVIMPANPKVGETYRQEYYKGEAEDMAKALNVNGSAKVPYGSFNHVLVTNEWTPLERGVAEHKYYAPGVGNIKEVAVKGPPETLELVDVKSTG